MDSSFQTPSSATPPNAATGQLNFSADVSSDQFIEDLFGPTSTGDRNLPEPRRSPLLSSYLASASLASSIPPTRASPERQQDDLFLARLPTIAVTVVV